MDNFNLKKYLAEGRLFEEITPLQQYVLDYEKDISGEVSSNVFQSIKSLESAEDVYDYYANERGWEDDEELKDDLKSIFKQVKNKFGGSELTDLQQRALSYVKKRFGNDEAKKDLDIIKSFKERQDFLDYVYKKVEDENNQSEGRLFEDEEDQFGDELDAFADDLADEIKDELEDHKEDIQKSDKELNEVVGVVGIIGYILLSNTIANMLSKFAKKQFAKRDFGKGEAAAKKIYDFTHKNEEAFKAPIRRIVGIFTKDAKKKKMISDILFAIVVLAMAGQAGGEAVSYLKKAGYLKGGLYGLKAAVKGTEVSNIIKSVVQDAIS